MGAARDPSRDLADAYLDDLGLGRRPPSIDALTEIVRRHIAQYSFASIGPRLGAAFDDSLEVARRAHARGERVIATTWPAVPVDTPNSSATATSVAPASAERIRESAST